MVSRESTHATRYGPSPFTAGPARDLDGGERAAGLANGNRLRPALARRDCGGALQGHHRPNSRSRSLPGQRVEALVGAAVFNRMQHAPRPSSVRSRSRAATTPHLLANDIDAAIILGVSAPLYLCIHVIIHLILSELKE